MTQAEFAQGWKLLIIQPWGRHYNVLIEDATGQMVPDEKSKRQLEFYFDKLKHGTVGAWMKTAAQYAMGDAWPTVSELRTTMRHHEAPPRALPDLRGPSKREPMPEEVQRFCEKFFGRKRHRFGPWVDEDVPEDMESSVGHLPKS